MMKIGVALIVLVVAACGGVDDVAGSTTTSPTPAPTTTIAAAAGDQAASGCADVVGVSIESGSSGFSIAATVSSADTGWEKYADAWQVRTLDGIVLGERILVHPHETEQPFTRSLTGVEIPREVTEVVVVARDLVEGFCGAAFTVAVPHP